MKVIVYALALTHTIVLVCAWPKHDRAYGHWSSHSSLEVCLTHCSSWMLSERRQKLWWAMGHEGMIQKPEQLQIIESFNSWQQWCVRYFQLDMERVSIIPAYHWSLFSCFRNQLASSLCWWSFLALVALMKDQVQRPQRISYVKLNYIISIEQVASYSAKGISAAHVTGDANKCVKEGVWTGEYQLVYITAELLVTGGVHVWRKMLVGDMYNESWRLLL